tara:strand:- start:245 stop:406 length:162 start_codon:yes stop_codon:yes gene_type:complete
MEDLKEVLNAIVRVYWQQEKDHWEEADCPDDHIFLKLNAVKNWLIGQHKGGKH